MKKKMFKGVHCCVYSIYCLVLTIVSVVCVAVYNLMNWVLDTWGLLSIDEIIFHLTVPLEGTNSEVIWDGINTCLPLVILVLLFMVAFILGMKENKLKLGVSLLIITFICAGSGAKAVYKVYSQLDVGRYIREQKEESEFIQNNYVDPRKAQISFPEKKRNLVYIFLESVEATYSSIDKGGAFSENCIPELTAIAEENVSFSNSDKLGGAVPVTGSGWTMAGIFTQTSGLPLKNTIGTDDLNKTLGEQSNFSSKICNIEDILTEQGYNQCFMIGSDATFGGRRAYFNSHGNCEIWDYNTAVQEGKIPEDYYVWWGFEDEKLFTYAKEKMVELSKESEPFNLTLLTVDSHFEDGYVCELCGNEFDDNQYANVMACSSRQISSLIEWIQQQDFYENTTIILSGDHLTMDKDFCEGVGEDYQRSVYNAFINLPEGLITNNTRTLWRKFVTMDMFPTTLAALGAEIEGDRLGLGTNLFSNTETLAEQLGVEELSSQLSQKSLFYNVMMNDIDYEQPQND